MSSSQNTPYTNKKKLLVCGSRGRSLKIDEIKLLDRHFSEGWELIEGCCKNSPDEQAENLSASWDTKVHHFPAKKGKYLKRNREMLEQADKVFAFWDGYSRGTSYTVAMAVHKKVPVEVFL